MAGVKKSLERLYRVSSTDLFTISVNDVTMGHIHPCRLEDSLHNLHYAIQAYENGDPSSRLPYSPQMTKPVIANVTVSGIVRTWYHARFVLEKLYPESLNDRLTCVDMLYESIVNATSTGNEDMIRLFKEFFRRYDNAIELTTSMRKSDEFEYMHEMFTPVGITFYELYHADPILDGYFEDEDDGNPPQRWLSRHGKSILSGVALLVGLLTIVIVVK